MATNVGSQTVTLLYGTQAFSRVINRRFEDIRKAGIYSGGYLSVVDSSHAQLSTLTCEISDGTYQVKISTGSTVSIAVASATPYVVLRWSYSGSSTDDYMGFHAVASPSTNDVVVGKCTFTGGGALQGFDYSERTTPSIQDLFLKVEPTADTELRVRVRAGRIQNGKETVQIPDQKTSLFTPPTSNSRVYLVYVNRASGAISIDSSGTAAASPSAPNYDGKLVLAEVTLASTATDITADNITDVRDFTNMSYDVDDSTVEVNNNGKLGVKDSVLGQSADVTGTTDISNSSGTWQDMEDMTLNLTTRGGKVLLLFSATIRPDSGAGSLKFTIDGTYERHTMRFSSSEDAVAMQWLEPGLSAGLHTFKVQWRDDSGTIYQDGASGPYLRNFVAIELPAAS